MSDAAGSVIRRATRLRLRLLRLVRAVGLKDEYLLIVVSLLIGVATGYFAHLFYTLIELAREFCFGHDGTGGLYTGRTWMLVVLPTVGALAVGYITWYFAREAKGHGVPEVMDALYRRGGEIRPRVAGAKAVASALTIGSGGSAGTEGPIIQIGAAIGSGIGQWLQIPRRHMSVVVACGVAAGIAAIFNAPIAGVLFALEVFLKDFSFRTFSPIVFSSVISCTIMHAIRMKDVAIFEVEALREVGYVFSFAELPLFLALGLLCALAAVAFIRLLYLTEDLADVVRLPEQIKPAVGAAGLGIAGAVYVLAAGTEAMPAFFGNGYPAIQATLGPALLNMSVTFLAILLLLKLIATCLTLGWGGSGGVFAPSLLMGAALGGAFGTAMAKLGLTDPSGANAFALVGMAAMVAGTTYAPLTAIVMLYEITREPKVILPVMFATIVAMAGAQFLSRDSIYTLKLRRRGVPLRTIADLTILRRITVEDVERQPAVFVHPQDPLQYLIEMAGRTDATDFVVVDEQGIYQGMVMGPDIRTALLQPEAVSLLVVDELMKPGVPPVTHRDTLDTVLDRFAASRLESLPIANPSDRTRIEGLVTRQAVLRRYHEELQRHAG